MRPIPDAKKFSLKPLFVQRYRGLLGDDYEEFIRFSFSFINRSIRINTLKAGIPEIKKSLGKNWTLKQIPWCEEGFWVESQRRDIGNTQEHALGCIYVQEAASMLPAQALGLEKRETVLDMCASPGSKSTQIAALMQNTGCLIANDYNGLRLKPLCMNLQRCGVRNAVITLMSGHQFARTQMKFDRVLVDAPCSGTGTVRTSLKTVQIWNPLMVKRLAGTQKKLLEAGFAALKKSGTLVYSTCSVEPEENEGVVDCLLSTQKDAEIEKVKLNVKSSPAIMEFEGKKYSEEVASCLRVWPQDNDTEGFFVAKIRKV